MLTYKKIDLLLQLFLSIATIVFFIIGANLENDYTPVFFYCYLGLGTVQVISAIAHFCTKEFRNSWSRIIYSIFTAIAIILFIIFWLIANNNEEESVSAIDIGYILLIITPVLAISYIIICWTEIVKLNKEKNNDK